MSDSRDRLDALRQKLKTRDWHDMQPRRKRKTSEEIKAANDYSERRDREILEQDLKLALQKTTDREQAVAELLAQFGVRSPKAAAEMKKWDLRNGAAHY